MTKRSLLQCFNARTFNRSIFCSKGHEFPWTISYLSLERGDPLELTVCQQCPDFSYMGEPVLPTDRGWLNKKEER